MNYMAYHVSEEECYNAFKKKLTLHTYLCGAWLQIHKESDYTKWQLHKNFYQKTFNAFIKLESEEASNGQIENLMLYNKISREDAIKRLDEFGYLNKAYQGQVPDFLVEYPNNRANRTRNWKLRSQNANDNEALKIHNEITDYLLETLKNLYNLSNYYHGSMAARAMVITASNELKLTPILVLHMLGLD